MATLTVASASSDGLRPVNLKTDLGPLADLMEVAFASSMDTGGRAAIREMRALSRLGAGVNILSGVNDLVVGIGMGYVWVHDGRLIGNVSIYPASLPSHLPRAWIIANVAVDPEFRGRGIARQLMNTSLEAIRRRGDALLQVEDTNEPARRLYDSLGFRAEGVFTTWKRPGSARRPPPIDQQIAYISRRARGDSDQEFRLAQRARGRDEIGWLRPLDRSFFSRSLLQSLGDAFSLRTTERLIIRREDRAAILASMWIERAFGATTTQLTLLLDPGFAALYGDALLGNAVRRFDGSPLTIEHPASDATVSHLLYKYTFAPQRTLVHMRLRA